MCLTSVTHYQLTQHNTKPNVCILKVQLQLTLVWFTEIQQQNVIVSDAEQTCT